MPLIFSGFGHAPEIPHAWLQFLALTDFGAGQGVLGYLGSPFEADPAKLYLAAAILLSGLCVLINLRTVRMSATVLGATLLILGLSLGVILCLP